MSNYNDDQITKAAKQAFIDNPRMLKIGDLDRPSDVNGRTLDFEILCNLPGRDGALWRQVRVWMAVNTPGLLERSPSPDHTLRAGRKVREKMKENGQIQPVLT